MSVAFDHRADSISATCGSGWVDQATQYSPAATAGGNDTAKDRNG